MSRIPVEIPSPIPHAARSIQVNHCRMPDCGNYGVPASTKRVKSGPSATVIETPIIPYKAQIREESLVSNASVAARNRP